MAGAGGEQARPAWLRIARVAETLGGGAATVTCLGLLNKEICVVLRRRKLLGLDEEVAQQHLRADGRQRVRYAVDADG